MSVFPERDLEPDDPCDCQQPVHDGDGDACHAHCPLCEEEEPYDRDV